MTNLEKRQHVSNLNDLNLQALDKYIDDIKMLAQKASTLRPQFTKNELMLIQKSLLITAAQIHIRRYDAKI